MEPTGIKRSVAKDRHGLTWEIALVPTKLAAKEDFAFWYTKLTPEERVDAVHECLLSALKARGINGPPRLRRVARRVERRSR